LRDELLPYKRIVGAVILAKNPALRTVVNKTGVIDTRFRTFPMEVVAGEDDTVVEVKHCGALFRFDFRCVCVESMESHASILLLTARFPAASCLLGAALLQRCLLELALTARA
jgi:hypothetical protein